MSNTDVCGKVVTVDEDRPGEHTGAPHGPSATISALAQVCAQLNFDHSLAFEAAALHDRVLAVLGRLSRTAEQRTTRLEQLADTVAPGARQDRLRTAAARARASLGDLRARHHRLAALDITEPRPDW